MSSTRSNGWQPSALFRWHLYSGMVAALLVILLSVSGVLLNHGHALGLDRRYVSSEWVLRAYGLPAPPVTAFRLGDATLVQAGERLQLDGAPWPPVDAALVGALALDELYLLATSRWLYLYTASGELVERVPPPELGGSIEALGRSAAGAPVVRGPAASRVGDAWLSGWSESPAPAAVEWSGAVAPPPALHAKAVRAYHARSISYERLLLDLHSGRFMGSAGPWLMDGVALLLILQVVSGIWLWGRRIGRV